MGCGGGINGFRDLLMNKSTLEKQTGLRAFKANCNYYLGDYGLGDGFIYQGYFDSRAWKNLFDQWWARRRIEVFKRDGYKCVICQSPRNIECDHIVNRSQGGDSSMENLQTLCHICHEKKTNNVS